MTPGTNTNDPGAGGHPQGLREAPEDGALMKALTDIFSSNYPDTKAGWEEMARFTLEFLRAKGFEIRPRFALGEQREPPEAKPKGPKIPDSTLIPPNSSTTLAQNPPERSGGAQ